MSYPNLPRTGRVLTLCCALLLSACATFSRAPVKWTAASVKQMQSSFDLTGEWNRTIRSGGGFGNRCDVSFGADGNFRKSCSPPREESGHWHRDDGWTGRTFTVTLDDRSDRIKKRGLDDTTLTISVERPDGSVIKIDGEEYRRGD